MFSNFPLPFFEGSIKKTLGATLFESRSEEPLPGGALVPLNRKEGAQSGHEERDHAALVGVLIQCITSVSAQ